MKKLFLWLSTAIIISLFTGLAASAQDTKFNMSYIYFGTVSSYTSLVDRTQGSLDEIAPNYFNLDTDGKLVLTGTLKTTVKNGFVKDMHNRGVRVVPYLTNDWDRQTGVNALYNRAALAADIARAVKDYNLDGVNVDLENLTPSERAAYVDFVRLLRQLLPDKIIAVAVAANPNGYNTGWQGSYDYAGLSEYCDYLMVMAYDEHWYGSQPGPVSGMSFVEKSVKYTLSKAPKEKIVLGLPFYGRIWSDEGGYPQGYGVSNAKVEQLLAAYSGAVTVDAGAMSARATIIINQKDVRPLVGSQLLEPGRYTIWYDNEQTLKEKLRLVDKYGLKGAGTWSLGQETAGTWDYYRLWLNGCTFADIQYSWAKAYILSAYLRGYVTGVSADSFAPDTPLTRAQAAAMLARMLGYPQESDTSGGFADTKGNWAEGYITAARKHGLVSGVGDNRFEPDRAVSRQEMAVMLNNILGYSAHSGTPVFSDVTPAANPWSAGAIAALAAKGVITGRPDGTFRPWDNITRAEMTALLVRMQSA